MLQQATFTTLRSDTTSAGALDISGGSDLAAKHVLLIA